MAKLRQFLGILAALGLLLAGLPTAAAPAAAPTATIHVNTTADEFGSGSGCSLREAIQAANTDSAFGGCPAGSGNDTIYLPAGTFSLTRAGANEDGNATGDLDTNSNISIYGDSPEESIIDGEDLDRVLHVVSGQVSLWSLTIRNGWAPDGAAGQNGVNPGENGAAGSPGADGGGIYNAGTLTIEDCIVAENRVGNGGRGGNGAAGANGVQPNPGGNGGAGGAGGRGGHGGGIYNAGTLTMGRVVLRDNQAGAGGAGGNGGAGGIGAAGTPGNYERRAGTAGGNGGRGGAGGAGGAGSGLANASTGTVVIDSCAIAGNIGSGGGAGGTGGAGGRGGHGADQDGIIAAGPGGRGGDGGNAGNGGSSSRGKGIFNNQGSLTLLNSTVELHTAGYYAGSGGQGGNGGQGGDGGDGTEENPACDGMSSGGGGTGGNGGRGGSGGNGGGIYSVPGSLTIRNSTIRNNSAGLAQGGGGGGNGGNPGTPGSGYEVPPCYNGSYGPNGDGGAGGGGGDGGSGGGIYNIPPGLAGKGATDNAPNLQAGLLIEGSTIAYNNARAGRSGGLGGVSGSQPAASGGLGGDGGDGGKAGVGAGISSEYTNATLTNSTLSGNAASFGGSGGAGGHGQQADGTTGAGGDAGFGGGIYSGPSGTFRLSNVTIASNLANGTGGSGLPAGADGRGGGVYDEGTFYAIHTLLGNNESPTGPDCFSTLDNVNFSLVENTANCTINGSNNWFGHDPGIGDLADNGGPTWTHLPLAGGWALENGDETCYDTYGAPITVDQRGRPRPADGNNNGLVRCDIGAVEVQAPVELVIAIGGSATGSTLLLPPGSSCSTGTSPCAETLEGMTAVSITATPDPGAVFAGWGDACAAYGNSPICYLTLDQDYTATATFNAATTFYTLTVTVNGSGAGNISSVPAGIDCGDGGTACQATYGENSVVALTAQAGSGSTFAGWGGACSGNNPTCEVTMDANKTVSATFDGSAPTHRVYLPLVEW